MKETTIENAPHDVIRKYILKAVNVSALNNTDDIFESGLVNSLFAIQLMTFIEKSFSIKVTMDDLDLNNFKSVNAISQFVKSKQEKAGLG